MKPILFVLPGDIPVFGYGVMLGLSCVLGLHVAAHLSQRTGIDARKAWWLGVLLIVIGIAGGRVHELLVTGKLNPDELTKLQHSGRTAYGGFLAGGLGAVLLTRWMKVPFWRFADAVAPTLALGLGLTRIGCFLAGCDYGFQTETWGVCFPRMSPAWRDQRDAGLLPDFATADVSLPVFPAQLLASAAGFLIFALALYWWRRRPRREGSVLLLFFGVYGLARAGLEQLRADAGRGELLGLSTSTTIGLITACVAALLAAPPLARLRPWAAPLAEPAEGDGGEGRGGSDPSSTGAAGAPA